MDIYRVRLEVALDREMLIGRERYHTHRIGAPSQRPTSQTSAGRDSLWLRLERLMLCPQPRLASVDDVLQCGLSGASRSLLGCHGGGPKKPKARRRPHRRPSGAPSTICNAVPRGRSCVRRAIRQLWVPVVLDAVLLCSTTKQADWEVDGPRTLEHWHGCSEMATPDHGTTTRLPMCGFTSTIVRHLGASLTFDQINVTGFWPLRSSRATCSSGRSITHAAWWTPRLDKTWSDERSLFMRALICPFSTTDVFPQWPCYHRQ